MAATSRLTSAPERLSEPLTEEALPEVLPPKGRDSFGRWGLIVCKFMISLRHLAVVLVVVR